MSVPYYGLLRAAAASLSLLCQPAPRLTHTPTLPSPVIPGSSPGTGRGGSGRGRGRGIFQTRRGLVLAAGLTVLLTAGCGSDPGVEARDPVTGRLAAPAANQAPIEDPQHTGETLWTILGLAKRDSERTIGPQTGRTVSPVLWEAARDTLGFAGFASEDPMTGLLMTNWYSPPSKPNERLRVSVFILSRALRSDSVSVTIDRQERSQRGDWTDTPVSTETVSNLETEILLRARQIHAERYRSTNYQ
jgi:hypothetical protein